MSRGRVVAALAALVVVVGALTLVLAGGGDDAPPPSTTTTTAVSLPSTIVPAPPTTTSPTTAPTTTTTTIAATTTAPEPTSPPTSTIVAPTTVPTTLAPTTTIDPDPDAAPVFPCDDAALLRAYAASQPLPAGATVESFACYGPWAGAVLRAPGVGAAFALFGPTATAWQLLNVGSSFVCQPYEITDPAYTRIGCPFWDQ
jgi:hypothetical protein